MTVQDTLTKAMSTCCSKLLASQAWCVIIKNPTGTSPLRVGQSLGVNFTVVNQADSAASLDYALVDEGGEHGSDPTVMSLNGLPPGTPITGTLVLQPGQEGDIVGSARLNSFKPMDLESIILEADVDGDGTSEPLAAMLVQPVSFPDCNRNGVDDAQDIAFGTSPDTNGNGFPDECEGTLSDPSQCFICGDASGDHSVDISDAVYLISYIFGGGPGPAPYLAGDADCSQSVDISDAVYLIAYIFGGGAQPCASCK